MSDAEFAELQSNSYLETEFFFYMLPCYYGIIAFLWRYCSIISLDAVYYIKKVQGEWLLKYFESEDESARVS